MRRKPQDGKTTAKKPKWKFWKLWKLIKSLGLPSKEKEEKIIPSEVLKRGRREIEGRLHIIREARKQKAKESSEAAKARGKEALESRLGEEVEYTKNTVPLTESDAREMLEVLKETRLKRNAKKGPEGYFLNRTETPNRRIQKSYRP